MSTQTPKAGDPVEVVAGVVLEPVDQHDYSAGQVPVGRTTAVTPTQVRRPWRSTVRTAVQIVSGLLTLAPFVAAGVYDNPDDYPAVVTQVVVASATFSRIMAVPQVEKFLRKWRVLSWLAAAPAPPSS